MYGKLYADYWFYAFILINNILCGYIKIASGAIYVFPSPHHKSTSHYE